MAIDMEYYGKIDPNVQYFAMCGSTNVQGDLPPYLKGGMWDQSPIVKCDHCGVNNKRVDPYCLACGAPLP